MQLHPSSSLQRFWALWLRLFSEWIVWKKSCVPHPRSYFCCVPHPMVWTQC
jgi:hypothetical protein